MTGNDGFQTCMASSLRACVAALEVAEAAR